jgi:hypothetical protein
MTPLAFDAVAPETVVAISVLVELPHGLDFAAVRAILLNQAARLPTVASMDEPKWLSLHPPLRRIGLLGERCWLTAATLAEAGRRSFVHRG